MVEEASHVSRVTEGEEALDEGDGQKIRMDESCEVWAACFYVKCCGEIGKNSE